MNTLERAFPALGTLIELSLSSEILSEDELLDLSILAQGTIAGVQEKMSFHDAESELTRLNLTAHREAVEISDDLREVLAFSLELAERSEGIFDPTVALVLEECDLLPALESAADPSATWEDVQLVGKRVSFRKPLHLDLGGVAKGWAVDQAIAVLAAHPVRAIINAGGDLRMSHWEGETATIRETMRTVPMQASALATSSAQNFEEGNDLVDPRNRQVLVRDAPVSVFAPTCMIADALTKVASLHPEPGRVLESYGAI